MNFFALLGFFLPLLVAIIEDIMLDSNKVKYLKYVKIFLGVTFLVSIISLLTVLSTECTIFNGLSTTTFADFGGYSIGLGSIIGTGLSFFGLITIIFDLKN
jgi:hypothetical protein